MPPLYTRVVARGFPSQVTAGQTGAGALESQGGTVNPAHGDLSWGPPTSTLTGFAPEGPAQVQLEVLADIPGPGEMHDPDQTPGYGPGTLRTHAAPWPGWAGSYAPSADLDALHQNSAEIHGVTFGALQLQDFSPGQPPGETDLPMQPWTGNAPGGSNQEPLTGGQRVLGGYDAIQGYDRRNSYGFDAGHFYRPGITGNVINAYLDPAERPFIVPQASGSYIPTDAVQGPDPWASYLAADNVNYNDPSAYVPQPEPPTLTTPLTAAVSWGW